MYTFSGYDCFSGKIFVVEPIFDETSENVTIYAAEIDINQTNVPYDTSTHSPSQADFVVYADAINITGPLSNPSRNIQLVARLIIFNEDLNVSIDTSGIDGHVNFSDLPAGGSGVGGGSGTDGGNVTIIADEMLGLVKIDASGGDGESGQNGANGVNGKDGENGHVDCTYGLCNEKKMEVMELQGHLEGMEETEGMGETVDM